MATLTPIDDQRPSSTERRLRPMTKSMIIYSLAAAVAKAAIICGTRCVTA